MSFTESDTFKNVKKRPGTGVDRGRTFALTPMRKRKKLSVKSTNFSKDFLASPYVPKLKQVKQFFSNFERPKENLYSWNCRTCKNKIAEIRPSVIIMNELANGAQAFGFCDGEDKRLDGQVSMNFQDFLKKKNKFEMTAKDLLKKIYFEAVNEAKDAGEKMTPHEFCVALLRKKRIRILNIGLAGVIVGRPAFRGWEGELRTKSGEFWVEDRDKVVVICNSALMKALSVGDILKTAGSYWELKNPNMACWEIIEMSQAEGSLCLVIYICH